jgi:hypothetical protein
VKKQTGGGKHAVEKGRRGAEKRKKLRVVDWHWKQEMLVARARDRQRHDATAAGEEHLDRRAGRVNITGVICKVAI